MTRFCIITAGRTGSTHLRLLLDSHPQIYCHGEVFGENLDTLAKRGSPKHHEYLAERKKNTGVFLSQRVFDPRFAPVIGFKILYEQLLYRWPALLSSLLENKDLRIIHLVRNNRVKRFLSEYVVGTITLQHQCPADQVPPDIEPFLISIEDLMRDLKKVCNFERQITKLFELHSYINVSYEDLFDIDGDTVEELQRFVGVQPSTLSSSIRKILPNNLRMLIKNIDEVERALAGTPFENDMI